MQYEMWVWPDWEESRATDLANRECLESGVTCILFKYKEGYIYIYIRNICIMIIIYIYIYIYYYNTHYI